MGLADTLLAVFQAERPGPDLLQELERRHQGRSMLTRSDQVVYTELDPLDEVYFVTQGLVRLFVGEGSNARTSLLLRAPALFGDRDILAGCVASQESARSISRAHLLCFSCLELKEAFASKTELQHRLTTDLLRRYARAVRFASYLAQPLEQRVLWLLWEHRRIGDLTLPPYESLALMTDASTKSIGRAVRQLQDTAQLSVGADRSFEVSAAAEEELATGELLEIFHQLGA